MNCDSINLSKKTILLELINQIFKKNQLKEINDLSEFIDVDRDIIIKEKEIFDNMSGKIFKFFDKKACAWYRRNNIKNYILTFFRYATSDIGYVFELNDRDITKEIDGKKFRRTYMLYTIKKKL